MDKQSFVTLEELKQEHKKRHNSTSVSVHALKFALYNSLFTFACQCFQIGIKGSARFSLFGSTVVENTTIESQSSVTVDLKWSHVESVLEVPPLSSTATLVSSKD